MIVSMLSNPECLLELGRAGRRFWSRHGTPETVGAWHEQLYESLLARETPSCAA
jgi:hypothetical protein